MKNTYIAIKAGDNGVREIIEAEQVPTFKDKPNFTESHGVLGALPSGYWKIWKNGKPHDNSPNDYFFKKLYEPYSQTKVPTAKAGE